MTTKKTTLERVAARKDAPAGSNLTDGEAESTLSNFARGSEWRQWDLHVHSPASYEWKGQKFSASGDTQQDRELVDQMILAMNQAAPAVFALMDYWTFDGWFALQKRLKEVDAPKLEKMVFPGIELRVMAPTKERLNLHAIFSHQTPTQDLNNFMSRLTLALIDEPLSKEGLIRYARQTGADKLKTHGFSKAEVEKEDLKALAAGHIVGELTVESYKDALERTPNGNALGFVPFTTYGGLGSVVWNEHYAFAMSLFRSAPIFEARDDKTWKAFVGRETPENKKWLPSFQAALGNTPRLPVSGSDAHTFVGVKGENDSRGYGDFPSGRVTWIKADPTWLGLKQAIKEPARRCHIGELPPKLKLVSENKTFYLDQVSINKVDGSNLAEQWFDGERIPLNKDLIAIIGNKGSGKSALADVIALVGNSRDKDKFSFLCPKRFRGRTGEPAKQFIGRLDWVAGEPTECNLGDEPTNNVELVRYIPQGRFEELCNEHISGRSTAFERELRTVVFDHLPAHLRGEALTFDELIEDQEKAFRAQLDEVRKRLGTLNREIASIERDLHPEIKAKVSELLQLKLREMRELDDAKPAEVLQPSDELTAAQVAAASRIEVSESTLSALNEKKKAMDEAQRQNSTKKRSIKSVEDQIKLFEAQVETFKRNLSIELVKLNCTYTDLVNVAIDKEKLTKLSAEAVALDQTLLDEAGGIAEGIRVQKEIVVNATQELNGPQKTYQAYQVTLAEWQARMAVLVGTPTVPDSKSGIEARLALIAQLPARLTSKRNERDAVAREIMHILISQRSSREQLFEPLQRTIAEHPLIGTEYDLKFKAHLQTFSDLVSGPLFSIAKQNVGELRGEEESKLAVSDRLAAQDMNTELGAIAFANAVHDLLHVSSRAIKPNAADLTPVLRKERNAEEIYDHVFGFEYLTPHYTLMFQDTPIEQLSPGQRGALLLIFYLLVDRGRNPIILDQPEENLDNETVVDLLVPVLAHAKESRQILMVTHNPNLAVVCDAEQIIMCRLDRKGGAKISYETGSIEDTRLNASVVKILEGAKPAFNNRGGKYH